MVAMLREECNLYQILHTFKNSKLTSVFNYVEYQYVFLNTKLCLLTWQLFALSGPLVWVGSSMYNNETVLFLTYPIILHAVQSVKVPGALRDGHHAHLPSDPGLASLSLLPTVVSVERLYGGAYCLLNELYLLVGHVWISAYQLGNILLGGQPKRDFSCNVLTLWDSCY